MPKMKTNRGAAKRFKATGTGKIKRNKAFSSHILTKKSTKENVILGSLTWSTVPTPKPTWFEHGHSCTRGSLMPRWRIITVHLSSIPILPPIFLLCPGAKQFPGF